MLTIRICQHQYDTSFSILAHVICNVQGAHMRDRAVLLAIITSAAARPMRRGPRAPLTNAATPMMRRGMMMTGAACKMLTAAVVNHSVSAVAATHRLHICFSHVF